MMTVRERFLEIMKCNPEVKTLDWEFAYFIGTLKNWYKDGLPQKRDKIEGKVTGDIVLGEAHSWPVYSIRDTHLTLRDYDVHDFFHLDEGFYNIPVNFWYHPRFEYEILEKYGTTYKIRDIDGIVKIRDYDHMSMPQFLEFPVKNRKDWEKLKEERFQLKVKERVPRNWEDEKIKISSIGHHPYHVKLRQRWDNL